MVIRAGDWGDRKIEAITKGQRISSWDDTNVLKPNVVMVSQSFKGILKNTELYTLNG